MDKRPLLALLLILPVGECFVPPCLAHVGTGIAVDPKGRIWFADTSGNRIWRIETDGRATRVASEIHSNVLVPAPDGGVFVENDRHTNRWPSGILHVSESGEIAPAGEDSGVMTLAGEQAAAAARGLPDVNAAVHAPEGSLVVRSCQSIFRVPRQGPPVEIEAAADAASLGRDPADCQRTVGLALDAGGNLYLANYSKRTLFRIGPRGDVRAILRAARPWTPTGVTVAGTTIYVLERYGHPYGILSGASGLPLPRFRVRKIDADGKITTLARVR